MSSEAPRAPGGTPTLDRQRVTKILWAEMRRHKNAYPERSQFMEGILLMCRETHKGREYLEEYKQYSMCINCMLCYSACPVYALDQEFIGPAAIALAQRYNLDSRDEGEAQRHEILSQHEGIWGCTFVGDCTRVCPKKVDPAGSIQRYKLTAALKQLKSFLMPWAAK